MTSFNRELGLVSAVLLVFLAGCASSGGVEDASEVEAPETSAEVQEVVVGRTNSAHGKPRQNSDPGRRNGR